MGQKLRKFGIAMATVVAVAGTAIALPGVANAQHGHWGGGHWGGGGGHWGHGGGWGWGGFGLGLGTGLALGAAPYYGGYGPYAYDYGGDYAYAGDCYIRRRWVVDGYGHRVLRRVRVCN
jgi:hypothetical protein